MQRFSWIAILLAAPWCEPALAQDPNSCDPGEEPDVAVTGLTGTRRWGSVGPINAFSFGTVACNVGTCQVAWSPGTPDHPVIGQNLFRLENGRFEQIGQSWLKHGFDAFTFESCGTGFCDPPIEDPALGVHCSDLYTAFLNGQQNNLGPKFEVDPWTGAFPYPPTDGNLTGDAVFKRLQVHDADLDPALHPGALYFVEGQYVAADDSAAGNDGNNIAYREVQVSGTPGSFDLTLVGPTATASPAIEAWAAADPGVLLHSQGLPIDGRIVFGSSATPVGGGRWRYEYAIQNVTSRRGIRSFSMRLPFDTDLTDVGFHDVDYHSGEPQDGTDWDVRVDSGLSFDTLIWTTAAFEDDPRANALRWGTLYNFRFEADAAPAIGQATLGVFVPDVQNEAVVPAWIPVCDGDGICDAGEDCDNCATDCSAQGGGAGCCGDDFCDPGETSCSCPDDCGGAAVAEIVCDDGLDDDCDGATDCADRDCCTDPICEDGIDLDLDTFTVCDCDDGDPDAWLPPGEITDLTLSRADPASTTLSWSAVPAGAVQVTYETLRSGSSNNFTFATICLQPDDPMVPLSTDIEEPAGGQAFFYSVRALNDCPGLQSLGSNSAGIPRTGQCQCALQQLPDLIWDFEQGSGGWTSSSLGGADTWHVDTTSCRQDDLGSAMFVSNGNDGPACSINSSREWSQLLGPAFTLPADGTLTLAFDALSFDEAGACLAQGASLDAHDVGLSTDGGASYLALNDCFPLADGFGNRVHHVFDVSAWAGQTVQIVFAYDTRDAALGHTFAVDDVRIDRACE